MKILILVLLFISLANSINSTQNYEQTINYGIYSDLFSAQPEIGNNPSQYFVCGFAFRQQKWKKVLYNCDCKRSITSYLTKSTKNIYNCNWCLNELWTMRNAFKAFYCHYENWNNQKQVIFTTGSKQFRNWIQYKCPKDQYATRVAPKFGWQHDTNIGLNGLAMKCQNNKLTQSTIIPTNYSSDSSIEYSNNTGATFISGFQMKYQPNGILTGVKFYFQPMIKIFKIEFKFDAVFDSILGVPVLIDTATTSNQASFMAQQTVSFNKQYDVINKFINQKQEINGYLIEPAIELKLPLINGLSKDYILNKNMYKTATSIFKFGKQVKTTFSFNKQLTILVPSCTQIEVNNIMYNQKIYTPYDATLTFVNLITGQLMGKINAKGIWNGMITSSIHTQIKQYPISNCNRNRNYLKRQNY